MLTAHSLCWLCQMPLAIAHWGMCSRCTASLLATSIALPTVRFTGIGARLALWTLPAKTTALAAAGDGE